MSRTVVDKTLRTLAIALACIGVGAGVSSSAALASAGGFSGADGTGGAGAASAGSAESALTGGAGAALAQPQASASSSHGHSGHAHRAKSAAGEQIATWFGPGFYGQKTACGQTMTPAIVGVASRTLPCGTLVLIDYKSRQLTVPVIDRGPYAHNGATWDLTWGAASALSIEDTVRVKTKIVGRAANTPLLGMPAELKPIDGATVAPAG